MIKIKSIEIFNHKIFGNIKFDFTINGDSVNNVIIAGENGVGKTKLLEELNNISHTPFFLNLSEYSQITHKIIIDLTKENYYNFNNSQEQLKEAILVISKNDSGSIHNSIEFISNHNKISKVIKKDSLETITTLTLNGLYSNVDINYNPRSKVQGPTDKTIDNLSSDIPKDIAYEIIQLLVNISIQDSCELATWVRENKDSKVPEEICDKRLKRFTNAFKSIFGEVITFKEIKNNTIPIFKKENNEIDISSLSSGEKQVIFRGVYLLQNKNSLKGVPVFIDEPEISMHPKWEEKIFNYYKNIFSEDLKQTSQIFIATHSEHILANSLNENDCLIIKLKEKSYNKFYKDGPGIILPTITISEIKYQIFDLYTEDFHCLLYGYIQENLVRNNSGKIVSNPSVKKTDRWLRINKVSLKHYYKQINSTEIKEYDTLPTYIRNCIDHPDIDHSFTERELENSTQELIKIITSNITK